MASVDGILTTVPSFTHIHCPGPEKKVKAQQLYLRKTFNHSVEGHLFEKCQSVIFRMRIDTRHSIDGVETLFMTMIDTDYRQGRYFS